jgi:hypothetical protein
LRRLETGFRSGVGILAATSWIAHRRPQRVSLPPSRKPTVTHGRGFRRQITRAFEPSGQVSLTETPAGKVATALHIGPYERLGDAHQAIHTWAEANKVTFAGKSWEIYGDWTEDTAKLETRVEYLLS